MKKTITINLGGRAFLITEEAYNSLEDYLSSLATTFKEHDSAEEIIADIEARISELCEKRLAQSHGEIIEQELVNEMINRIGKPEAMLGEEGETENKHTAQEEPEEKTETTSGGKNIFENMRLNKKYYLNSDDRMAGGVISGLAAYFKTDVTILRIIALVLIITTGLFGIIAYFVVWCIAPTAGNTSEKLRMQGIEPTPENIAEKITNDKESTSKAPAAPSEKEKNNITRLVIISIAGIIAYLLLTYPSSSCSLTINNTRVDHIIKSGITILSCIFLAGFFVQKANLPRMVKNILLVAITLFALFVIFIMTDQLF